MRGNTVRRERELLQNRDVEAARRERELSQGDGWTSSHNETRLLYGYKYKCRSLAVLGKVDETLGPILRNVYHFNVFMMIQKWSVPILSLRARHRRSSAGGDKLGRGFAYGSGLLWRALCGLRLLFARNHADKLAVKRAAQSGFTLVELIVAVGIMSAMGLISAALIYESSKAQMGVQREVIRAQTVQALVNAAGNLAALNGSLSQVAATDANLQCLTSPINLCGVTGSGQITGSGGSNGIPFNLTIAGSTLTGTTGASMGTAHYTASGSVCAPNGGQLCVVQTTTEYVIDCPGLPGGSSAVSGARSSCPADQATLRVFYTVTPDPMILNGGSGSQSSGGAATVSAARQEFNFAPIKGVQTIPMISILKGSSNASYASGASAKAVYQVANKNEGDSVNGSSGMNQAVINQLNGTASTLNGKLIKVCPQGQVMYGIDSAGNVLCRNLAQSCPAGKIFVGFTANASGVIIPTCINIACGQGQVFAGYDATQGKWVCDNINSGHVYCNPIDMSSGSPKPNLVPLVNTPPNPAVPATQFAVGISGGKGGGGGYAEPICKKKTCGPGEITACWDGNGNVQCVTTDAFVPRCVPGPGSCNAPSKSTSDGENNPASFYNSGTLVAADYDGTPFISQWINGEPLRAYRSTYKDWGAGYDYAHAVVPGQGTVSLPMISNIFADRLGTPFSGVPVFQGPPYPGSYPFQLDKCVPDDPTTLTTVHTWDNVFETPGFKCPDTPPANPDSQCPAPTSGAFDASYTTPTQYACVWTVQTGQDVLDNPSCDPLTTTCTYHHVCTSYKVPQYHDYASLGAQAATDTAPVDKFGQPLIETCKNPSFIFPPVYPTRFLNANDPAGMGSVKANCGVTPGAYVLGLTIDGVATSYSNGFAAQSGPNGQMKTRNHKYYNWKIKVACNYFYEKGNVSAPGSAPELPGLCGTPPQPAPVTVIVATPTPTPTPSTYYARFCDTVTGKWTTSADVVTNTPGCVNAASCDCSLFGGQNNCGTYQDGQQPYQCDPARAVAGSTADVSHQLTCYSKTSPIDPTLCKPGSCPNGGQRDASGNCINAWRWCRVTNSQSPNPPNMSQTLGYLNAGGLSQFGCVDASGNNYNNGVVIGTQSPTEFLLCMVGQFSNSTPAFDPAGTQCPNKTCPAGTQMISGTCQAANRWCRIDQNQPTPPSNTLGWWSSDPGELGAPGCLDPNALFNGTNPASTPYPVGSIVQRPGSGGSGGVGTNPVGTPNPASCCNYGIPGSNAFFDKNGYSCSGGGCAQGVDPLGVCNGGSVCSQRNCIDAAGRAGATFMAINVKNLPSECDYTTDPSAAWGAGGAGKCSQNPGSCGTYTAVTQCTPGACGSSPPPPAPPTPTPIPPDYLICMSGLPPTLPDSLCAYVAPTPPPTPTPVAQNGILLLPDYRHTEPWPTGDNYGCNGCGFGGQYDLGGTETDHMAVCPSGWGRTGQISRPSGAGTNNAVFGLCQGNIAAGAPVPQYLGLPPSNSGNGPATQANCPAGFTLQHVRTRYNGGGFNEDAAYIPGCYPNDANQLFPNNWGAFAVLTNSANANHSSISDFGGCNNNRTVVQNHEPDPGLPNNAGEYNATYFTCFAAAGGSGGGCASGITLSYTCTSQPTPTLACDSASFCAANCQSGDSVSLSLGGTSIAVGACP